MGQVERSATPHIGHVVLTVLPDQSARSMQVTVLSDQSERSMQIQRIQRRETETFTVILHVTSV